MVDEQLSILAITLVLQSEQLSADDQYSIDTVCKSLDLRHKKGVT